MYNFERMRHILFLSYAAENAKDTQFLGFCKELSQVIAPGTPWSYDDDRISFRDRKNLRLGEKWEPELRDALEVSSVMLCITSEAYYRKAFCGKEFYIFQQRLKKYEEEKGSPPPVILPVIWAPHKIPPLMNAYVWKQDDMPEEYEERGLRELRWLNRSLYKKALAAIARKVVEVWQTREKAVEKQSGAASEFEQIPNAFGGAEWIDAVDGKGWIHGPTVANVVYGAGTKLAVASPKYGDYPREWKPFLPPDPQTVGDLTRSAIHAQSLRYREIPVDDDLDKELKLAQGRKNLIVMVADAASLDDESNAKLSVYDGLQPEGTALLMPWQDTAENSWKNEMLQKNIDQVFPVKSRTPACYRAPLLSVDQMRNTLDITLVEIRDSLTKLETRAKPVGDAGPAMVSGSATA